MDCQHRNLGRGPVDRQWILACVDAWIALLAALVGGGLAIAGQLITRRSEGNARRLDLLLEQCSRLAALSDDYRNRLWEERVLGMVDRTSGWDFERFTVACAHVRILCRDEHVIAALDELATSGKALGGYWRRGEVEDQEVDQRYERDKAAVAAFLAATSRYVGRRLRRV
jgi:hypothetical protein